MMKPLLAMLLLLGATPTWAGDRFVAATETSEELRELYDDADESCRVPGQDVKVTVACVSRAIYGDALNEKGWCLGKEDQANAEMSWHECEPKSLTFPPLELPNF